mmetsp:Transcript_15505/g.33608  ORF Transcript_15505/g.33608 Transcript_15505/m.33608 type:complete len:280 (+) Transcript_15505:95-934(+)
MASPKDSPDALSHLSLARQEIASVSDELRSVKNVLAQAQRNVSLETAAAVTQALRFSKAANPDKAETLSMKIRIAELEDEKASWLRKQTELEAEVGHLRRALEAAKMDPSRQQQQGADTIKSRDHTWEATASLQEPDSEAPAKSNQDSGERASPKKKQPKSKKSPDGPPNLPPANILKQAAASIEAVERELAEERAKRAKLKEQMRKDLERLDALYSLAERQRGEIAYLRHHLHAQLLVQRSASKSAISSLIDRIGSREPSKKLSKQHSEPTRLPSVPK